MDSVEGVVFHLPINLIVYDYARICPGRLLVDEALFVVCAMFIAVFDIQKKVKNGVVIEPVHRMISGFVE